MQEKSQREINRINTKPRNAKYLATWLGFLEGLMSCSKITPEELEPLKKKTQLFMDRYEGRDQEIYGDAQDIILNFPAEWDDLPEIQSEYVEDFLQTKLDELCLSEYRNEQNLLNGFLEGIATDGSISVKEAKIALYKLHNSDQLCNVHPYDELIMTLEAHLIDESITKEESLEISEHISRIVGNSFSDTGLVEPHHNQSKHDFEKEFLIQHMNGKRFALTGNFYKMLDNGKKAVKRADIQNILEQQGMIHSKIVTQALDVLIISDRLSQNYATETAGTKILKARELNSRDCGIKIKLVGERVMWKAIDSIST